MKSPRMDSKSLFAMILHCSDELRCLRTVIVFQLFLMVAASWGCNKNPKTAPPPDPPFAQNLGVQESQLIKGDSASPMTPVSPTEPRKEVDRSPVSPLEDGSWTVHRLVVLANHGPILIDLRIQVGKQDLPYAFASAVQPLYKELWTASDGDPSWNDLLQNPLIRSGWLGNLTPLDPQNSTLTQSFDRNQDTKAQWDELIEFLLHGVKRQETFLFRDEGTSMNQMSKSPWGPLDRDGSSVLNLNAMQWARDHLMSLDFDGDLNISLDEVMPEPASSTGMAQRRGSSILPTATVVFESEFDRREDETKLKKRRQRLATQVLEKTTYLDHIRREDWPGCSDRLWDALDASGDGRLDLREITALLDASADIHLLLRLPAPSLSTDSGSESKAIVEANSITETDSEPDNVAKFSDVVENDLKSEIRWEMFTENQRSDVQCLVAGLAATVEMPGLNLLIRFEDIYVPTVLDILTSQVDAALRNPQLKAAITQQLQLSDQAFEIIDFNNNQRLDRDEQLQLSYWLACRLLTRFQATWSLSPLPWFQILDQDMNSRLSEWELGGLEARLRSLDLDGDEQLTSHEMPLVVSLRLVRSDEPLFAFRDFLASSTTQAGAADDWFSAMDSNGDGMISRSEFLGSRDRFQAMDLDGNGFISRVELQNKP